MYIILILGPEDSIESTRELFGFTPSGIIFTYYLIIWNKLIKIRIYITSVSGLPCISDYTISWRALLFMRMSTIQRDMLLGLTPPPLCIYIYWYLAFLYMYIYLLSHKYLVIKIFCVKNPFKLNQLNNKIFHNWSTNSASFCALQWIVLPPPSLLHN